MILYELEVRTDCLLLSERSVEVEYIDTATLLVDNNMYIKPNVPYRVNAGAVVLYDKEVDRVTVGNLLKRFLLDSMIKDELNIKSLRGILENLEVV